MVVRGEQKIMARKTDETEGNPVGCTVEDKILKGNTRKGSREGKTGTVIELSSEVR